MKKQINFVNQLDKINEIIKLSEEIGKTKQTCNNCKHQSRKCWKKCDVGINKDTLTKKRDLLLKEILM